MFLTAEEFFRTKLKELHPYKEVITLSTEIITAEQGMRWGYEYFKMRTQSITLPKCSRTNEGVCQFEIENGKCLAKIGDCVNQTEC